MFLETKKRASIQPPIWQRTNALCMMLYEIMIALPILGQIKPNYIMVSSRSAEQETQSEIMPEKSPKLAPS